MRYQSQAEKSQDHNDNLRLVAAHERTLRTPAAQRAEERAAQPKRSPRLYAVNKYWGDRV